MAAAVPQPARTATRFRPTGSSPTRQKNKRRILAMLEQGDRDIAAGRGCDLNLDEVLAELDAT